MTKLKLVFYGSCQVEAVCTMLKGMIRNFDDLFDTMVVTNWKYILQCKPLPTEIFDADVFIYQPFKSSSPNSEPYQSEPVISRIRQNKTDVKTISYPFMNFAAYFPDYVSSKQYLPNDLKYPFGKFPLVHADMISHLDVTNGTDGSHETIQKCINDLHSDDFIPCETIQHWKERTFASSVKRDEECDVRVTEFIAKQYTRTRLFHTIEHPSNVLLMFVARQVIDNLQSSLGISFSIDIDFVPQKELLYDHTLPILPCVKKTLCLEFPLEQRWFKGSPVSLDDFAKAFYKEANAHVT